MKVIHIDMDQFFAAVEQRDNLELKGKLIAVGHDAERGVVLTASYEARWFGVHSVLSHSLIALIAYVNLGAFIIVGGTVICL